MGGLLMVLTLSRIDCRALIRMIVAGTAWGLSLSTGFSSSRFGDVVCPARRHCRCDNSLH
jgi:hypothetical protein